MGFNKGEKKYRNLPTHKICHVKYLVFFYSKKTNSFINSGCIQPDKQYDIKKRNRLQIPYRTY